MSDAMLWGVRLWLPRLSESVRSSVATARGCGRYGAVVPHMLFVQSCGDRETMWQTTSDSTVALRHID